MASTVYVYGKGTREREKEREMSYIVIFFSHIVIEAAVDAPSMDARVITCLDSKNSYSKVLQCNINTLRKLIISSWIEVNVIQTQITISGCNLILN